MSRRVALLAGLAAALGLVRGVVALVDRPPPPPPALVDVDPAAVAGVVLGRGGATLALARDAASPTGWWVLGPAGARAAARPGVDALLERVVAWRADRPAGADPARHAERVLDEPRARALRLEAPDGRALADLLVGRLAGVELADALASGGALDPRRLGLFVRRRGEDAAWVVAEFLTRELEPDPRAWLAPPLGPVRPEDVARLRLPGLDLAFGEDGGAVDPARAAVLLDAALDLVPTAVAAGAPPGEALVVEVVLRDGEARQARLWTDGGRALAAGAGGVVEVDLRGLERLRALLRE
ncbi:MAG: DUF4340 domain-containing protein [Planctomycetes bacterium]|nr:DUF4340 domain-containing protein [Planctomycetota bacterium]